MHGYTSGGAGEANSSRSLSCLFGQKGLDPVRNTILMALAHEEPGEPPSPMRAGSPESSKPHYSRN